MSKDNVLKLISKCKSMNDGKVFLSLKPRVDDLETTVAHLYSFGGEMCHFNMPDGDGFHIWDKEYEKYSYGSYEFVNKRGFDYLFSNWDSMIKCCCNRACDKDNFKKGKVSGKEPRNHYERERENRIAALNSKLSEDLLAVIDMEYSVDKNKIVDAKIDKNPKADMVCVGMEEDRITFYITEYKSTEDGFGVSLAEHYDDMSKYYDNDKIKKHLIKTLQERVKYGLVDCEQKIKDMICNISIENIDVELVFLFSHVDEFKNSKKNVLKNNYKYIFEKSKSDSVTVKYACIKSIEKSCLKKSILKDFKDGGEFEFG
ncbi:MAG: hypothetical protein K6G75_05800 [Lachnospiraceae bacterium]|nr:hypothetical protein [Lachnospiraceae bacterium]